jgi:hypothetical protein
MEPYCLNKNDITNLWVAGMLLAAAMPIAAAKAKYPEVRKRHDSLYRVHYIFHYTSFPVVVGKKPGPKHTIPLSVKPRKDPAPKRQLQRDLD